MADKNLRILIRSELEKTTKQSIINQLEDIKKKYGNLEIKLKLNDSVTKTLQGFTSAMEKFKAASDNANKTVTQTQDVYKNLDGSVKTVTQSVNALGEVTNKTRTVHDANKKAMTDESVAASKLAESIKNMNKAELDSISVARNKNNVITGVTAKSSKGYTTTTQRLEADGQTLIGSTTTANYAKDRAAQEKEARMLASTINDIKIKQAKTLAGYEKNADRAHALAFQEKIKLESHLGLKQVQDQFVARKMAETQDKRFNADKLKSAEDLLKGQVKIAEKQATAENNLRNKQSAGMKSQLADIQKARSAANNNVSGVTDTKALEVLNRQYNKLTSSIQTMQNANRVLTNQEVEGFNRRIQSLGNLATRQKQATKATEDLKNMQTTANKLVLDSERKFGKSDKYVDNTKLRSLAAEMNGLTTSSKNFSANANRIQNEMKLITAAANSSTGSVINFSQALQSAIVRLPTFMLAGMAIRETFSFFKDGISFVNELNKSLTELSIVYMVGQKEVEKYGEQYSKLAFSMSISTKEVLLGAVEFARQGLSAEETTKRMQVAIQFAKIAGIDFNTSAKVLTATVNSMGVDIGKAADVISYLGDATASSADEIGAGLQKVGGTAGSVNLSLEKTASWIAIISAKTRESGAVIGSSVKSILARMMSLKEKGFDEEDGTQVNQVAKALGEVDIQLMDTQGNFRDFGLVMDELGGKWSSLTNRQQAYLATTVNQSCCG